MLDKNRNNFDLLRIILSSIIVIVHLSELSEINIIMSLSRYFSSIIAVDSFFIVSGFLIFMSFDKSYSYMHYLSKRIRRIAPAYILVIFFSAFFLFFISSKNIENYLNIELINYIIFNLFTLNFIQPTLAGVFEQNPIDTVNGALWTIKIEIMFYILVPFIAYISKKTNKLFTYLFIYLLAIVYSIIMLWLFNTTNNEIFFKLEKQIPSQLAFFISGALLYHYYNYFKSKFIYILSISIFILYIHHWITPIYPLYPISLAVVIIYFSIIFKYLGNWRKFGDVSFGLYIWHFPIIQVFVNYNLLDNLIFGLIFLFSLLLSISLLSWHLIEKPFLYSSSH